MSDAANECNDEPSMSDAANERNDEPLMSDVANGPQKELVSLSLVSHKGYQLIICLCLRAASHVFGKWWPS